MASTHGLTAEDTKVVLFPSLGEYYFGKRHGKGVYIWPEGRRYDGLWKNGRQDGEGEWTSEDGVTKTGLWKDGARVKWLGLGEEEKSDEDPPVN